MASRLQDVILRGTAVARPAATAVAAGTIYFSTDTSLLDRSDGTNWQTISPNVGTPLYMAFGDTAGFAPADATTYYFGNNIGFDPSTTVDGGYRIIAPLTGKIIKVYAQLQVTLTLGSAGVNSTFTMRNITAATTQDISTTVPMDAAVVNFNNAAMTLDITIGDALVIKLVTGTWATNPTGVFGHFTIIAQ